MMKYILLTIILYGFIQAPENSDISSKYEMNFCLKEQKYGINPYFCLIQDNQNKVTAEIPMHLIFEIFVRKGFLLLDPEVELEILSTLNLGPFFIEIGTFINGKEVYGPRRPGYFIPKLESCDFLRDPNFLETLLGRSFITNPTNVRHNNFRLPNSFGLFVDGNKVYQEVIDRTKEHEGLKPNDMLTSPYRITVKPGETMLQVLERVARDLKNCSVESKPFPKNEYTSIAFTKEHFVQFLHKYLQAIVSYDPISYDRFDLFYIINMKYQEFLTKLNQIQQYNDNISSEKALNIFYNWLEINKTSFNLTQNLTDIALTTHAW